MDLAKRINRHFLPNCRLGLPRWHSGKESVCQCRRRKRHSFNPWVREMTTHSSVLAGKFHGQRSLAGYSPWGHRKVDTTEHTHTHTDNCKFSLPRKTKSTQDSAMGQFPLDHSYRPRQVQKAYTHTHTHTHTQITPKFPFHFFGLVTAQSSGLGKLI